MAEALWNLEDIHARGLWLDHEPGWRCLTELRCLTCRVVTRHAVIREDDARNFAEQLDRRGDRTRKLAGMKVEALRAGGATVRLIAPEELRVESAPVELAEYSDERGIEARVCMEWDPDHLVECLDEAAWLLVDLDQLGEWTKSSKGQQWRGVAIRCRARA